MGNNVLSNCSLFKNIKIKSLQKITESVRMYSKEFGKDEMIFCVGDSADYFGIVKKGEVSILQEDYLGNRNIMSVIRVGKIFAEAFCFSDNNILPVSVLARTDCKVLFVNGSDLLNCVFEPQLAKNIIATLSEKNVNLTKKIKYVTNKSIKEKVISFLDDMCLMQKSKTVKIPFNRQELADYLAVDRSALSYVLSKMQKDGLIEYRKNLFKCKYF